MTQPTRIAATFASCVWLTLVVTGCDDFRFRLGQGALPRPKPLDQTAATTEDVIVVPVVATEDESTESSKLAVSPSNVESLPHESGFTPIKSYRDRTFSETALDALGRIGEPAVPPLIQSLDDPNPLIRYRAASVLARIGPDAYEAVPALVRHLNDVDFSVRREAARALGQIGPLASEAVPQLIEALRSDDDIPMAPDS